MARCLVGRSLLSLCISITFLTYVQCRQQTWNAARSCYQSGHEISQRYCELKSTQMIPLLIVNSHQERDFIADLISQSESLEKLKPKEAPTEFTKATPDRSGRIDLINSRYKTRIRRSDQVCYPFFLLCSDTDFDEKDTDCDDGYKRTGILGECSGCKRKENNYQNSRKLGVL